MKKKLMIVVLAAMMVFGAVLTGCGTQPEEGAESSSQSSQPGEPESPSETEGALPESSSSSSVPAAETVPPSSRVPEPPSSTPSSGEPSSEPPASLPAASEAGQQDANEPASMEEVLALQEYLFDSLPQTSYAYLNAGAQEGYLTIGYVDLEAIKPVVHAYAGSPCPVIYAAAECSAADTLDFLGQVDENIDFPGGAYMEPVSDIPGAFEGAMLGIYASSEEQAQEIEDEILALAQKVNFPQEHLKFYHMTLGYNPDT